MSDLTWHVLQSALGATGLTALVWYGLYCCRRSEQRARQITFNKILGWRMKERENAIEIGLTEYAESGHPSYDPKNYDSLWEYARAVRGMVFGISVLHWIGVYPTEESLVVDGMFHRRARIVLDGIQLTTVWCNPDHLQLSTQASTAPITCLRCLTKESSAL